MGNGCEGDVEKIVGYGCDKTRDNKINSVQKKRRVPKSPTTRRTEIKSEPVYNE